MQYWGGSTSFYLFILHLFVCSKAAGGTDGFIIIWNILASLSSLLFALLQVLPGLLQYSVLLGSGRVGSALVGRQPGPTAPLDYLPPPVSSPPGPQDCHSHCHAPVPSQPPTPCHLELLLHNEEPHLAKDWPPTPHLTQSLCDWLQML